MEEKDTEEIKMLVERALDEEISDTDKTTEPTENREKAGKSETATKREKMESERDRKARKAFRKLTDLDEEGEAGMSLRAILGGDILGGRWFRRQLGYVALLVVLAIIYVSNRYACQREEIRRDDLADTLIDRKYKALTISSRLTEFSMRSNVEENLTDTTLKTSTKSSYYLNN